MEDKKDLQTEKDLKRSSASDKVGAKYLSILFLSLLLLPILVLGIVYNINPEFKDKADHFLASLPGPIGDSKRNEMTPEERHDKVRYLATYYSEIEQEKAVDKLYIIKQEDERLYRDIITTMSAMNIVRSDEIIDKIRARELNKDLLVQSYDEAQGQLDEEHQKIADRINKADLIVAKKEVKERLDRTDFVEVLNHLNDKRLAEILFYLDEIEKNYLLNKIEKNKRNRVMEELQVLKYDDDNLIETAEILNKKPTNDAISYIQSNPDINKEQLASIFYHMDIGKAARIAVGLEDRTRLDEALFHLTILERLYENEDGKAKDISELVDYISEYNRKIDGLVSYYKKLSPEKSAAIFEKMIKNSNTVSVLSLNDDLGKKEKLFQTTDRIIALDVASKMKPKILSTILDEMPDDVAKQFTTLLAHPSRAILSENFVKNEPNEVNQKDKISLSVDFQGSDTGVLSDEFEKRTSDLAKTFDEMTPEDTAKVVNKFLNGDLNNKKTIVSILSKMAPSAMGKLLSTLPKGESTTISNMLATKDYSKIFYDPDLETLDRSAKNLADFYNEMQAIPLARLIKKTYDDSYDFEDSAKLDSLVRILNNMDQKKLSEALDLLNPEILMEITGLIHKYTQQKEVN